MAASSAARMGVPLLSGAAIGCDQAAQREALARGGRVCAVLGSGANVVYPSCARDLLEDIVASGGAVASIVPWDTDPVRWAFVKRNDVLAALAALVVVVEAGLPSGTFRTAEQALELDREVLVFPGSVFAPQSRGSNYLAAEWPGVGVVCDEGSLEMAYSRLFGRLRPAPAPKARPARRPETDEDRILAACTATPMRPQALAGALGLDLPACMQLLGRLELEGRIVRLVDGTYSPTPDEYNGRTMRARAPAANRGA
jgi:DNA processing protein